jgi:hypothetical protein
MVIKTYQYSRNAHKIALWPVDQGFTLQNTIGRSTHFPRDVDISKRKPSIIDLCFTRGNYIGPHNDRSFL